MCSSILNSKLEPTLENLENLDISAFQAPEDLLDGCRVRLYYVINADSNDVLQHFLARVCRPLKHGLALYLHKSLTK